MRIVVKVGTSTLAHPGGRLNIRHTEDLVKVWSDIKNAGHELIVVSSAATGLGVGKLQIQKPRDITTKQAAAAVGQCELMYTYDRLFGQYNHTVAQMLLTWEDFDHENRLHNLRNTLERLLELGAIPIINENDPIACEEYSLGDNATLAALVGECSHADLVVHSTTTRWPRWWASASTPIWWCCSLTSRACTPPTHTPMPTRNLSLWWKKLHPKLRRWPAGPGPAWAPAAC